MSELLPIPGTAQQPLPFAVVDGVPMMEMPDGLYIPPDALEVFLDQFSGPLDLLLYLIRRSDLDITALSVSKVTQQYIEYITMMGGLRLDLASEYLVMAATLAEWKSRLLLPVAENEDDDEEDPRAALIRQLLELNRYKPVVEHIKALPRLERDVFTFTTDIQHLSISRPQPHVKMEDLAMALQTMSLRAQLNAAHQIETESLSVQERIDDILKSLNSGGSLEFTKLFRRKEGRLGVAVTLLAILDLMKASFIECRQAGFGEPIYIRRSAASTETALADG